MADLKSPCFRWRGPAGLVCLPAGVALAALSAPPFSQASWINLVFDGLAWLSFSGGLSMRLWSTLYIGGRKEHRVVSEGPYSLCRNPLYIGSFLVALSMGLFLKSAVFAAGLLLVTIVYVLATVPAEERHLRQKLGEEYAQYCREVPRFWPRLSGFRTPKVIEVRVKGLRIESMRLIPSLGLPVLMQIIAYLRFQPWWPHFFTLP